MKELVFLLEGRSEEEMLRGLLPRLFPDGEVQFRYIPFQGKQDLERQLVRRLRGYANPDAKFVIIRDQDVNPNCKEIKQRLADLCNQAGKPEALVRIACKEVESFYLADLSAVELGLEIKGLSKQQQSKKFRAPDYLGSPAKELTALTNGKYQKVGGSRQIGKYLDIGNVRSESFRQLISGIRKLATFENA